MFMLSRYCRLVSFIKKKSVFVFLFFFNFQKQFKSYLVVFISYFIFTGRCKTFILKSGSVH